MSYILEALKKADQERVVGAVPNLATPHEPKRPPARSHRWLWVVALLLAINVVLAVMLLTDRQAEVPLTEQAATEPRPARTDDPSPQPVQQTREIAAKEAPEPKPETLPRNERTPSGGELVMLPEPANFQGSGPSSVPVEGSAARLDAATAPQDLSKLPSWYELPLDFRNRLSLPRLDLHAYSEEPQNRFILVNLKKYREGDRLESGLILEEILPDGMVLSYQGERFLLEK
jgi:general secretion pathway protein B